MALCFGQTANEKQRERYSQWPTMNKRPSPGQTANEMVGQATEIGYIVFSTIKINNLVDLALGELAFSKVGSLNRSFWNLNSDVTKPFATTYFGGPDTPDPGRLSIQGSSFTTFRKAFRDPWMSLVFENLAKEHKAFAFIVDLKGCHGCFQAALTKYKTPRLFSVFSKKEENAEKLDLWETIIASSNNTVTIRDKGSMKIVYYAAARRPTVEG